MITTDTITAGPSPSVLLIEREPGGAITYVAIGMDPPAAIDMLRRALIHVVAQHHSLATVPVPAAIASNGHSPHIDLQPSPGGSRVLAGQRAKPGPKPGGRRRKIDLDDDIDL